jgi:hypothetical protein
MGRPDTIKRLFRAIRDMKAELSGWDATDAQLALAMADLEDAMVLLSVLRHELRERRKGART